MLVNRELVNKAGASDATTGREMVRFDQLTSDICSK
jgi:hypothetical protein